MTACSPKPAKDRPFMYMWCSFIRCTQTSYRGSQSCQYVTLCQGWKGKLSRGFWDIAVQNKIHQMTTIKENICRIYLQEVCKASFSDKSFAFDGYERRPLRLTARSVKNQWYWNKRKNKKRSNKYNIQMLCKIGLRLPTKGTELEELLSYLSGIRSKSQK